MRPKYYYRDAMRKTRARRLAKGLCQYCGERKHKKDFKSCHMCLYADKVRRIHA